MTEISPSWEEIAALIVDLQVQIVASGKKYDLVIGIARGGLIPSVCLSHGLSIPHGVFSMQSYVGKQRTEMKIPHIQMVEPVAYHHNLLIVDDINDSGRSLQTSMREVKYLYPSVIGVDTAVLYGKEGSMFKTTYCSRVVPNELWINFIWERRFSKDNYAEVDGLVYVN